jgi:hypothetical protein
MKKHDKLPNFMDGIFDDLLDKYSEPQSIELRHIIEESSKKSHKLADLSLHWLIRNIHLNFVVWETQIFNVQLL